MAEKYFEKKVIEFEGKPYFLYEREKGLFHIVLSIEVHSRKSIKCCCNKDILISGEDIKETSNQDITLALTYPLDENPTEYIIDECRKYAKVSWHDYVSLDLDNFARMAMDLRDGVGLVTFSPKLYNKIIDN
ncbi:hypothetical protein KY342_06355 [Candidatus Woesearchaeota archaeon]|nr:hypothetical protein [Candidatus Woesearchaeota archaeon]